jgi:hypothetical protein
METMLLDGSGFDFSSLGLDAGTVLAVNGLTHKFKEFIREQNWTFLDRFVMALPFLCALAICYPQHLSIWPALKCSFQYGLAATFLFNAAKKGILGE